MDAAMFRPEAHERAGERMARAPAAHRCNACAAATTIVTAVMVTTTAGGRSDVSDNRGSGCAI